MPILITPEIIAATKTCAAGWSLLELREFKKKPNKKNPGVIDYYFIFECISGPGNTQENEGRTITSVVYGNALAANVAESANLLIGLATSLLKCPAAELVGQEVEFENMSGQKVWGEIIDEPYEGRLLKKIRTFTPDNVVPF